MYSIEEVNEKTPLLDLHPLMAIRTMNVLLHAGYKTVGDILSLTEDDVVKCRNAGRRTVEDAMRFISEYKECHGYTQSETLISPSRLIEYCQKCAEKMQEMADKSLQSIGNGESEQSAFGACAYFSQQARMFKHDIPEVIRSFMAGGVSDGKI